MKFLSPNLLLQKVRKSKYDVKYANTVKSTA